MFTIILRRQKCVGCNYCKQGAPDFFAISKKDGKSVLLHSQNKGQADVRKCPNSPPNYLLDVAKACPVHIIDIRTHKEKSQEV